MSNRWHMNRLGLIDFWFYDNEEFNFKDGHMMLRGGNGSGKSVTMQSFIPLLLDGNKNSSRLDPFGSRSRKIEDYLIDDETTRDERIGYLYLEFKREDLDLYKTIGMGMRAKRNSPLTTWYFVIEDNRRINRDLDLYVRNLAVTKQTLKGLIGDQLIETRGEYMSRVNEAIFGFDTDQEYKEVLDLLIQLRTPKLSNSLKPTTLNEILNMALQPLSDDDLRPMTEAISSMDATKDQVTALKLNVEASKYIINIYEQYNHRSLLDKAQRYLDASNTVKDIDKSLKKTKDELEDAKNTRVSFEDENKLLELDEAKLKDEKRNLLKDDFESLVEEINYQKQEVSDIKMNIIKKIHQIDEKENLKTKELLNKKNFSEAVDSISEKIKEDFSDLEGLQEQLQFEEHIALENELMKDISQPFNPNYTYKRIETEKEKTVEGIEKHHALTQLLTKYDSYMEIYEKIEYELEKESINRDKKQLKMKKLQEESIIEFHTWHKSNEFIKLSIQDLEDITLSINNLDRQDTGRQIDAVINRNFLKTHGKFLSEKEVLFNERDNLYKEKLELSQELIQWKNLKDPVYKIDEYTQKNRALLDTMKVGHISLYELLEFDTTISDYDKGIVEEKLFNTGLLGTQIIHQDAISKLKENNQFTKDQYLITSKELESLSPFVISESFAKSNDWEALFAHLGVDGVNFKSEKHFYTFHSLSGSVTTQYQAIYIGKLAREAYRASNIQRLDEAIHNIENMLKDILRQVASLEEAEDTLNSEKSKQPLIHVLNEQRRLILSIDDYILEKTKSLSEHKKQLETLDKNVKEARVLISNIANRLGISSTKEAFENRKRNLEDYMNILKELSSNHKLYLSNLDILNKVKNDLENIDDDIYDFREEKSKEERKLERLKASLQQKETLLDKMGYEDIKKKLDYIENKFEEIQKTLKSNHNEIGRLINMQEEKAKQLIDIEQMRLKEQEILDLFKEHYINELNLGYVGNEENPSIMITLIMNDYPKLKRIDTLNNELQEVVYQNRGNLQEYNLTQYAIFDEDNRSSRIDVTARYAGENINILKLNEYLELAINEQEMLLEAKDRELIEEILINTISKKIRNRIQHSRQWVARINRYMDSMTTSSGLNLNLNWQSKRAETDDEMHSEKLVKLMERDVRLLKESDLKSLSRHFRSKITLARKRSEMEETHESFHQIMRNVMDFRTWFDFKIMTQKQGEKKKELTNSRFNTFSGGEKAMSMYIPLFSAVAAKFEGGNKDAPHIIALDEAFAGVDENNIGNMFELIRKFNFDYIMNSQVLWGDYPSVKSLAIYELFRPENARFVTVVGYEWNGVTKSMVTS